MLTRRAVNRILSSRARSENWIGNGSLLEVGTRSIFNEDHDMFREMVRRYFKEQIEPNQAAWDKQGHVPREIWTDAGEMGLLGVNTSDEIGGIGGDFLSAMIVAEEQQYIANSSIGWSLHSDICMPYISKFGTPEQLEKFIPPMVSGHCISAIAMTEPGAGSDLQGIRTNARRDGDDWILNGSKTFITNGWLADMVIVVAITNPQAKKAAHGISLFLIEDGMEGFNKGKILNKVGLKGQDTAELFFDDVRVPTSSILGGEAGVNRGFGMLMGELPRERLMIGVQAAATMEAAYEFTKDYVMERKAFGKTLSNLQTIQHKLAEVKTDTAMARCFTDRAMQMYEDGTLDYTTASMSKYWVTEKNNEVCSKCLQMFGGWGYMWEYPIARMFADSRVYAIYGGSNEIMKELIARQGGIM